MVITKVSIEGNFTTFADFGLAGGYNDAGSIVDIHRELSTAGGATVLIPYMDSEQVGFSARSNEDFKYIAVGAANHTVLE